MLVCMVGSLVPGPQKSISNQIREPTGCLPPIETNSFIVIRNGGCKRGVTMSHIDFNLRLMSAIIMMIKMASPLRCSNRCSSRIDYHYKAAIELYLWEKRPIACVAQALA
ncbi:hypothetical protein ElyMa_003860300 [Elysia marginata]|uniref:Uncharacterized protein n=1 Tax=Elysia marginata TaxID=1093978 RepID=A0AAV4FJZ4_9GAST|nr:hypothetical protein ElyMa_003860300 [Elysia marginata]